MEILESIKINSKKAGPRFLLLGSIHGNEHAGTTAIKEIVRLFDDKKLTLLKGELICIAPVNKMAYGQEKRCIDEDLNRVLKKTKNPFKN